MMRKLLLLLLSSLFFASQGQVPAPLPIDAYGVWERGDIFANDPGNNPEYDFMRGFRMDREWSEIQPNNSADYNWSAFKEMLQIAVEKDKYIYTNILVGPQCPGWIYDDVPLVKASGDAFPRYPYYLDEDYKAYYFAMIENYAKLLREDTPEEQRKKVLFVQVMTGSTGDEEAYKGDVLEGYEEYDISEAQWQTFRLEAFAKFKEEFLEGDPNTRIPLVFNNIDPSNPSQIEEWNWVVNNIGSGFGIKGSAYVRGHHLTYEKTFREQWYDYLVNPTTLGLYSRAEMDQSYTWTLYQINLPLGFYWGALSGLNTGLSIWDLTKTAVEAVTEEGPYSEDVRIGIQEAYDFFNKYAPQIHPATATAAYSIFHEGLNSANTVKFPEGVYGAADKGNVTRYVNICNAYADRGAKMEHPLAATYGQVWQRHNQTGYNDAGWEIPEGNYERWIEQINPDQTSIGLFRINADSEGILDAGNSKYDRFARSFEHLTGRDSMFFKFHDDVFSASDPEKLTFKIIWFDKMENSSWEFRYDKGEEELSLAETFTGTGSGQWKTETIILTDASMKKGGAWGSDFALVNTDDLDDIFHGIEVDIVRADDDKVSIVSPQNGDEFPFGDTIFVTAVGNDLQGIERVRFTVDNDNNFLDDFTPPYTRYFTGLSIDTHTFQVEMKDSLGYLSYAEPVTIKILPASDTVYIESPPSGSNVPLNADLLVRAFAYDYDGIDKIGFRVDEEGYSFVNQAPWEYLFSDLSEGPHTLRALMIDLSGDSIISAALPIQVVDMPDSVSITFPSDGEVLFWGENVTVTTYCYDNDGIERIRFRLDNADNWNNVLSPPYEYTYTGMGIGTHLIEVQMKDSLENRIFADPVRIEIIPPDEVSIISPSEGDKFTIGYDIKVIASGYDNDGIASVGFSVDEGSVTLLQSPPYELAFAGLEIGSHTFRVQMTDVPGNTILAEPVTVMVVAKDSISITSPENGAVLRQGEVLLVTTGCYDSDGIAEVGFRVDDGEFDMVTETPYSYTYSTLSKGEHMIETRMTDMLGNSVFSEAISIRVVAPDSVRIRSPLEGDTLAYGEDLLVTVDCYDFDGIEKVGFRSDNGSFKEVSVPPYEYTFTGLSMGNHTVEAQMTDSLGNTLMSEKVEIVVLDLSQINERARTGGGEYIFLYPSLVEDILYWDSRTEIETIRIFTITGTQIILEKVTDQGAINLSHLDSGFYLVQFRGKDKITSLCRIVKR